MRLRKYWQRKRLQRRLQRLRRSPKIFIPTPRSWIVIPFKPLSLFLIIILLFLSAYLILRSDIFLLRHLRLQKTNSPHPSVLREEELKEYLQRYWARSLLLLSPAQIEEDLTQHFLALAAVKIEKKYPDTLIIHYRERQPLLIIVNQGREFLVDKDALLYFQLQGNLGATLPRVQLKEGSLKKGDFLPEKNINLILQALDKLKKETNYQFTRLEILPDQSLKIFTADDKKFFLPLGPQFSSKLSLLLTILQRYQQKGDFFIEIDLRYNKTIVR